MRECQFGRIEDMQVRDGQPVFSRDMKVVRIVRLGGDGNTGKSTTSGEFELKRPVRNLFDILAHVGNGTVLRLEFRHGLPLLLETTGSLKNESLG